MSNPIEIQPGQLAKETLQAIIEEFIMREGTDYGMHEVSLDVKVEQLKRQLASGQVVIMFDSVSESCTLMPKDA
jgi:uncharacterized protein YheU (UPF0270 family)